MTRLSNLVAIAAFALAAVLAWATAHFGASWVERRSIEVVQQELTLNNLEWVEIYADGLELAMTGTAPTEAERFRAMTLAGGVVDAGRLIDAMDVVDLDSLAPPRFSLEILRNDAGISLIGLIPTSDGRQQVTDGIAQLEQNLPVTDMVEEADHPVPENWGDALEFAMNALQELPRSKISVNADRVEITAIADSAAQKARLEAAIARRKPRDVALEMTISAPRPVISPFTLRFTKMEDDLAFDVCSADSVAARDRILAAASKLGYADKVDCVVGLGVPSTNWAEAVEKGFVALDALGGGSITFSDADVTLIASDATPQAVFDRVIGQLESDLPEVFSLHSVLPPKLEINGTGGEIVTPEFVATRSPEGIVQMRGRLIDVQQEAAVLSYARAQFGTSDTYVATRQDAELPDGWASRVFAGLEGLSYLDHGSLVVQPEVVEVRGVSGSESARANISRILSSKLGENADFRVDVRYDEMLDPLANIPTPEECVARMNGILAVKKITFAPGSTSIDGGAALQVRQLADAFEGCDRVRVEIGGHTDSQGGEGMNQSLSQQRADAVRIALVDSGVNPDAITSVGYGEAQPIADNDTEEGREANRRIAFRLIPNTSQGANANE